MPLTAWNVLCLGARGLLLVLVGRVAPDHSRARRMRVRFHALSKGDTLLWPGAGAQAAPGRGGQAPRPDGAAESPP